MRLSDLLRSYALNGRVRSLRDSVADKQTKRISISGLRGSSIALTFASILQDKEISQCSLFVLDDEDEAGYFYQDLIALSGESSGYIMYFPSSFSNKRGKKERDDANGILRTEALGRIAAKAFPLVMVTYPEALAEKVVNRAFFDNRLLEISKGDTIDVEELSGKLAEWGFRSTDYVYQPGEFAVRGSIIDVYSFASENPYRLDFFGDDVESLRTFDVRTQLSIESKQKVILTPEAKQTDGDGVALMSLLPENTFCVAKNINYVAERVGRIHDECNLLLNEKGVPESQNLFIGEEDFRTFERQYKIVEFGASTSAKSTSVFDFSTHLQPIYHKNFEIAERSFSEYIENGFKIYVAADSPKQLERLKSILEELNSKVSFTPVEGTVHEGFADDDMKMCLFTDHEIFDRFHRYNLRNQSVRNGRVALTLKELNELQVGDYVVHIDHGVGRFAGLVRMNVSNVMQEMIKLKYANDDVVFVSINSLHKLSKYRGKEGEMPHLNRLGTGAWQNLKDRTKKKIKDIARDLIRLYAARRGEKGFAFSHDNYMQHELEASFIYEDTPDQLKATQAVKADMEKSQPMDRLVCGDVGFGKTEVAIRAAFKAACDSKQTAVMVPTTVLAFQHYKTFSDRLKDFPVKIEYLSRARSTAKTKEILSDLKEGKIDILIGTHKLIGRSVKFKDLGLLIVDEEQKFGVAVKEKLRQMKTNVDTLTMTATPIPRTLQFSLMGARDLSVIQTPPPNRYPIETQINTFSEDVIADAINFEMSRGGQVFYVCNRISALPNIANTIHRKIPEARVAIGHGQMPPEQLEKVVMGFVNYDYDVLISTTIVENGIDIPNANTIIIDGAQRFGLSDLHQMRGRVGRSNKKAFCYLLAPPLSSLTTDERRRLEAVENFSDLGSGIYIAMQDLDIRGAGNLLGAEQSGFIADLGYETYQKVLSEAVSELKTQEFSDLYAEDVKTATEDTGNLFVDECTIESDLQMYFPEQFVPGASERMLLYRELDTISDDEELVAYRKRLADRFGTPPPPAEELMRVVALRREGRRLGIERIFLKGGKMSMFFVSNNDSAYYKSNTFGRVINYAANHVKTCRLEEVKSKRRMLVNNVKSVSEAVNVLGEISRS